MRQYLSAKEQYPDALMFFRIGDFYELFYEDAITTARALDLKLTSRDKNDPDPIPMCGVPHHAAQNYLSRLLEQGFNVAICEQLEDPAKVKGMVKRGVVRVLTPAIVLDGDSLTPRANQFVASVVPPDAGLESHSPWGFAAFDLTTGELFAGEIQDLASISAELRRLDARELVVAPELEAQAKSIAELHPKLYVRLQREPTRHQATTTLEAAVGSDELVAQGDKFTALARHAAGAVLQYAAATQPNHQVRAHRLMTLDARDYLVLDDCAQRHLELFLSARGDKQGSLLSLLDETITSMGARRLRHWLAFPLMDVRRIRKRHDAVAALVTHANSRGALREQLHGIADIERIAVRATLNAVTPKDLNALRESLAKIPAIHALLEPLGPTLKELRAPETAAKTLSLLNQALHDDPATSLGEGAVFREGYDTELDRLAKLANGGRESIAQLELRERERSGIGSLKVLYNRVFGYFIEITKANLHKVPSDYKRKQTIAGGERFLTEELVELERTILSADEGLAVRERELFEALQTELANAVSPLTRVARVLADLDSLASLAEVAHRLDYVRPELDESLAIELTDARHPVIETVLPPGAFVANSLTVDARTERLFLVTGPNMAGKSTLMRMVALQVILAQMGSFVPATSARIGVVDRVFTRVGASDDLSRGQSTFMVEMTETASILRSATTRSLVVFDEIGRGTSTYDGLAIAWAVAEYLHDVVKCRGLFATHYHELCSLTETKRHAVNVNVSAREVGEAIVFLHKLQPGGASRSHGIAVGRLAGLPEPVIARARALLKDLERGDGPGAPTRQRGLFEPRPEAPLHPALATLSSTEIDRMTPMDALNLLAQLKGMIVGPS
ncbi:MAG: DNA mismatch repair protein MutS [Deltaproteobacteria bacterium]|nr:DNA mismatch repair protein MutS [Deltaproteobacteria bacterium]